MTISNPAISIIIPNFNCLAYLPTCLQSIDQQGMSNIEIIIVDDGSSDGSRDYLEQLTQQRDDVSIILESGVGPGAARNIAAQIAQGEFLAFLDADDVWTPEKLAMQWHYMRDNSDVSLSFTNYQHIAEQDQSQIIPCFDYWPEFQQETLRGGNSTDYRLLPNALAFLFKENVVGTSSVMCRRDAFIQVGGFDTELPSASDWDLWLKLAKIGHVAFTTQVQMEYLVRSNSISRNLPKRIDAMKSISAQHLDDAKAQCKNVQRFVDERLLDAWCEYYDAEKNYPHRMLKHFQAFARFPNKRHLKGLLKSVVGV